jgi:hypothetical protein
MREAITSLEKPLAARRMILARTTSRYGDVYFRAIVSSLVRSVSVSSMEYGLRRGNICLHAVDRRKEPSTDISTDTSP